MNLNDNNNTGSSIDCTRTLLNILCRQKKGLKICHINAQSLYNKFDEFELIFENSDTDIICISETWFKPSMPDSIFRLFGYKLFRCDRVKHVGAENQRIKRGGGVAIFVRESLKCNVVCHSSPDSEIEYIFLALHDSTERILLGCVYRPDKNIDLNPLIDTIENISLDFENIIIAGDFNSNILNEELLTDAMLSLGLFPTNVSSPTHFSSHSNTLLDIFFISQRTKILLYDQIAAPTFSRHDLIFLVYDYAITKTPQTYSFRDFKHINCDGLYNSLNSIDWQSVLYMASVDEKVAFLSDKINFLYELYVPLKTKTMRQKSKPTWFNHEIHTAIKNRNKQYNRWKRYKLPSDYDEYIRQKKHTKKLILSAKIKQNEDMYGSAIINRRTWKYIQSIGLGKKNNTSKKPENLDELNEKFAAGPATNTSVPASANLPVIHNEQHQEQTQLLSGASFSFRNVTQSEVFHSILSIKSNATGSDNFNPRFLKLILPVILPVITDIFNAVLTQSVYPQSWKKARVIPIPKTNSDFRPIAILPFLSKALEKLMAEQITNFLTENSLLAEEQSGFRAKRSCNTALINVCEDIRMEIDDNKITFLTLLDHTKAFDSLEPDILCGKLDYMFHFSSHAIQLIRSYLCQRSQYISLDGEKSKEVALRRGVPQGSVLGPLLFTLFINDLPKYLNYSKIHIYADDVQVYISSHPNSISTCIQNLNCDLNVISQWACSNGLTLNPSKSKCLIINRCKSNLSIVPEILVGGSAIEIVDKAKNLGIIFNGSLSFNDHIRQTAGRIWSMLRTLWHTQHSTPLKIKLIIAKTYLIPTLLYASELFAGLDYNASENLRKAFNNIVRYVFGLKRSYRISERAKEIYGMDLNNFLDFKCLTLLFKIVNTKEPSYLFNRLNFVRSARSRKIVPIRYNYLISERHFYVHTIRLWNSLPNNFHFISNVNQFKRQLKNQLS